MITFFENKMRIYDPKLKRFPTISIIVPAYNEARTICQTLKSLLELNYPKNKLEILVVNDGSTDETHSLAKKFSGVRVLTKKNGGKGSALNLGLRQAQGELIAVMDADSFVSKNILRKMVGYFRNDRIMAVTPTLKVHNPRGFWHQIQYIEYLFSVLFRKIFSFLQSVYVTPGPFSIYRKAFFEKHGEFDENNVTEDLEIALRIQSQGYEIENSINAEVFTVAPDNFKDLLHQRVRWYTGVINNLWGYRALFTPKNGNLGILVLPVAVISVALALAYLVYYGILFVNTVADSFQQVSLTGFDLAGAASNYWANFSLLRLINPAFMLVALLLTFMLIMFGLAKIYSRDKAKMGVGLVMYTLTYGVIFSAFWFTTLAYKILQLRVRW